MTKVCYGVAERFAVMRKGSYRNQITKLANYIESRAERFAECRAGVRADLRADGLAEKIAPMQIHLQKRLQNPRQKQMLPATKMPHWDYNCVKMIQTYSDKVQSGTGAESRAEHFAETGADTNAERCAVLRAETTVQKYIGRGEGETSRSCGILGDSM